MGVRTQRHYKTDANAHTKSAEIEAMLYGLDGRTAQHFLESTVLVDEEGISKNAPEGLTLAREVERESNSCAKSEVPSQWIESSTQEVLGFILGSACIRYGGTSL